MNRILSLPVDVLFLLAPTSKTNRKRKKEEEKKRRRKDKGKKNFREKSHGQREREK